MQMAFHQGFLFLLVSLLMLCLLGLWSLCWSHPGPIQLFATAKMPTTLHRLLKPCCPDDCPCTGYLGHLFKNKPFEREKDLLPLLANTGRLVYNPKSSPADSCLNDDTLTEWRSFCYGW